MLCEFPCNTSLKDDVQVGVWCWAAKSASPRTAFPCVFECCYMHWMVNALVAYVLWCVQVTVIGKAKSYGEKCIPEFRVLLCQLDVSLYLTACIADRSRVIGMNCVQAVLRTLTMTRSKLREWIRHAIWGPAQGITSRDQGRISGAN